MEIDELRILHGLPIDLGVLQVHPLTCHEICMMGQPQYNQYLSLLLFTDSTIQLQGMTMGEYETALLYSHADAEFRRTYAKALSTFIKEPLVYDEDGFYYVGDMSEGRVITKPVLEKLIAIVKKQNLLKDAEAERAYKPVNDRARQLMDQIRSIKAKIHRHNKEQGLDLSDIISIVSSYAGNLNILSVWNLTVYQLYMTYIRLIMKDNYEANLYLLPHQAKPQSVELQHWNTKIKNGDL